MRGQWKGFLLDILFPRVCAGCKLDLPPPLSGPLCGRCLRLLRPLKDPVCLKCGVSLDKFPAHRYFCPANLRALDCIRAAFPYKHPLTAAIHSFKYARQRRLGPTLGGWMAGLLHGMPDIAAVDAVVPVPLHHARLKERGFNQAQILAEAVARQNKLPLMRLLERKRSTRPQARLGRSRRARNIRNAFRARPWTPKNLRYLLIDDVCATGATLESCARALKDAGASVVMAYVLARD